MLLRSLPMTRWLLPAGDAARSGFGTSPREASRRSSKPIRSGFAQSTLRSMEKSSVPVTIKRSGSLTLKLLKHRALCHGTLQNFTLPLCCPTECWPPVEVTTKSTFGNWISFRKLDRLKAIREPFRVWTTLRASLSREATTRTCVCGEPRRRLRPRFNGKHNSLITPAKTVGSRRSNSLCCQRTGIGHA